MRVDSGTTKLPTASSSAQRNSRRRRRRWCYCRGGRKGDWCCCMAGAKVRAALSLTYHP
jgi:hypothetical protein